MSEHNEHFHSTCEKEQVIETVFIECHNCINHIREANCCKSGGSIIYEIDCNCIDKTITTIVCKKCECIKDKITCLKDELDELLYNLSYDIKTYNNCENRINRIHDISKRLREFDSLLLEKL
jgi:hypothetical protein